MTNHTDKKGRFKEYQVKTMFYEGKLHYHIERRINGGKWKLLFGGMDYKEANYYYDNPEAADGKSRYFKIVGICILIFMVVSCTFLYFRY